MEEANPQDLGCDTSVSMDQISTVSVEISSLVTTITTVSENTQIKNQFSVSSTGVASFLQPLIKCSEKVLGEKIEGEIVENVYVNKEEEEKQENGRVVLEQVEIHKEIRVSSSPEEAEITSAEHDLVVDVVSGSVNKEVEEVEKPGENEGGVLQEGEAEKEVRVSETETVEDTSAVVEEAEKQDLVVDDEMLVCENVNGDSKVGPVGDESMDAEEDVSGDVKTTEAEAGEENMVGVGVKVDSSLAAKDISGAVKTTGGRGGTKNKQGKNQAQAYDMGVSSMITSVNDSNFGSLVVDLGICQNMDEFVKHNEINELVEKGGNEFSASDLVWGKVKSHPWWPGQIFDPRAASKLAKKHQKHDRKRLLVAYYGDQTFAWNVASSLKPFEAHFSQMEKQTDMEEFRFAIGSALGEISRRVQQGLICSCVPDEACSEIKSQIITNAGIRADSSRRDGVDKNVGAATFEPCKIVEYVKNFAPDPLGGVRDKIKNVVTQAQLAAFYRSKGHPRMAEFGFWGGLLDTEAEIPALISINEEAPSEKTKLESQDKRSSKPAPSSKKHKSVGSFSEDLAGKTSREWLSQSSNENGEFRTPGSFKVGESLRRVASQLKGSPPILNSSGERSRKSAGKIDQSSEKLNEKSKKRKITIPKEYSDPDEMLSQLHLAARDPMKGYSFLTIIVGFFTDYRNSINLDQTGSGNKKSGQSKSGGNRKLPKIKANAAEIYSDEEDDPYGTDMISEGTPEEQSPCKIQKRKRKPKSKAQSKKDSSIVELEKDPPSNPSLVVEEYSSSEESEGSVYTIDSKQPDHDVTEEPDVSNLIKNDADEPSPTALVLNFTQAESIPLETDLNKIFSRFGPLLESYTEVTRKTCRAKVVFKNRNDAEVAFSSAGKFSIFGPGLASYQLRYLPSTSSAASPCPPSAASPCPPSTASPVPPSSASPVPPSSTSPTLTFEETN